MGDKITAERVLDVIRATNSSWWDALLARVSLDRISEIRLGREMSLRMRTGIISPVHRYLQEKLRRP